ncbi:hypothetical protein BGX24_009110 [Mortierella sp. AD032]|nr:hypothetical protein BGX24_009110 [Mortierella sp. AD032]
MDKRKKGRDDDGEEDKQQDMNVRVAIMEAKEGRSEWLAAVDQSSHARNSATTAATKTGTMTPASTSTNTARARATAKTGVGSSSGGKKSAMQEKMARMEEFERQMAAVQKEIDLKSEEIQSKAEKGWVTFNDEDEDDNGGRGGKYEDVTQVTKYASKGDDDDDNEEELVMEEEKKIIARSQNRQIVQPRRHCGGAQLAPRSLASLQVQLAAQQQELLDAQAQLLLHPQPEPEPEPKQEPQPQPKSELGSDLQSELESESESRSQGGLGQLLVQRQAAALVGDEARSEALVRISEPNASQWPLLQPSSGQWVSAVTGHNVHHPPLPVSISDVNGNSSSSSTAEYPSPPPTTTASFSGVNNDWSSSIGRFGSHLTPTADDSEWSSSTGHYGLGPTPTFGLASLPPTIAPAPTIATTTATPPTKTTTTPTRPWCNDNNGNTIISNGKGNSQGTSIKFHPNRDPNTGKETFFVPGDASGPNRLPYPYPLVGPDPAFYDSTRSGLGSSATPAPMILRPGAASSNSTPGRHQQQQQQQKQHQQGLGDDDISIIYNDLYNNTLYCQHS